MDLILWYNGVHYSIESTVGGKSFVTARGWDDLSTMMKLYEKKNILVKEQLISQYLQKERVDKDFAVYYDLFKKYRVDYPVEEILEGKATEKIVFRAKKAKFDERLSLIGLILDAVNARIRDFTVREASMKHLVALLREIGNQCGETDKDGILAEMEKMQQKETAPMKRKSTAGTLSTFDKKVTFTLLSTLKELEIV